MAEQKTVTEQAGQASAHADANPHYFQILYETLGIPIILADADTGAIIHANKSALQLFEYDLAKMLSLHQSQLHPREQHDRVTHFFKTSEKSNYGIDDDIHIITQSGKVLPVEITTSEFKWENRRIRVGIFRDATIQKQYEDKIKSQRDFLQTLIDTIPSPVFYKNTEGRYIGCNAAFGKFLGLTREEIIGKTVFDIAPKECSQNYYNADQEIFRNEQPQVYESVATFAKQGKVNIRFHKVAFHNNDGTIGGILGIIEDLTDLKITQMELTTAKEKAEAAAQAKSNFLAVMSHEIRTPLNGIIGMADLLLESELEDRNREYISILRQSADSLLNIVTNILDSVRFDENKIQLESVPFKLSQTIQDSIELLRPSAAQKNIPIDIVIDEKIPKTLLGDPGRFAQALINLVSNSIKFSSEGSILVESKLLSVDNLNNAHIQTSVTDSGIGIDPEDIPKLFQKFSQGDSSISRKFGGTGLGLTISKQIITLMNGEITVTSEKGRGSTFTFTIKLPLNPSENKSTATDEPPANKPKKDTFEILAVEDDRTNQFVIQGILKHTPYHLTLAGSGKEALEKIRQNIFDLILMDVQMPIMDGLETTRHIRKMDPPRCDTPIIALTADASRKNSEHCISVGMNGFLEKPIKKQNLIEELDRVCKQRSSSQFLPSTAKSFLPADHVLNLDFLNELKGVFETGDFNTLVDTFIETAQNQCNLLDAALQSHDHESIQSIAHLLKGASSNVGATQMAELAANICNAHRESRLQEMEMMAQKLRDILTATIVALDRQKI